MLAPISEGAFQMRVDRSAPASVAVLLRRGLSQDRRRHAREGRLAPLPWGFGGGVVRTVVCPAGVLLLLLARLFDPRHRNILLCTGGSGCCEDESDVLFLAELEQQLVRIGIIGACTPPARLLDPLDRAGAIPLPDLGKDLVQLFQSREQFGRQRRWLRGV